jgi:molybdopterin-guanine dinucleotide biosynthesis protein A
MFDAIVLAGGAATRLGGADKPAIEVGGDTLLDRTLAAVSAARRVVVVGPPRPVPAGVRAGRLTSAGVRAGRLMSGAVRAGRLIWCREQPPGGGPVAAIAAGFGRTTADAVVVLAADLPWIAPAVPRLLAALGDADVAVLVDASGRRSYLAAAWRRTALRAALAATGGPAGVAARRLFDGVEVIEVLDSAGWAEDCDTWSDVERARRRADREGTAP